MNGGAEEYVGYTEVCGLLSGDCGVVEARCTPVYLFTLVQCLITQVERVKFKETIKDLCRKSSGEAT
jgi:hypothetical protein